MNSGDPLTHYQLGPGPVFPACHQRHVDDGVTRDPGGVTCPQCLVVVASGKQMDQLRAEVANALHTLAVMRAKKAVVDAAVVWAASTGTEATLALRDRVAELHAARKAKE